MRQLGGSFPSIPSYPSQNTRRPPRLKGQSRNPQGLGVGGWGCLRWAPAAHTVQLASRRLVLARGLGMRGTSHLWAQRWCSCRLVGLASGPLLC